jgi:hypothetical protein
MFDTARYQPTRVCAAASGFSILRFGTAKGTLVRPMPSSIGDSVFGSGTNSAIKVGPTLRCSQAVGLPDASMPASRCSTDTV